MALARVHHAVAPSLPPVPSEGNRLRASVHADAVADDVVLRQFSGRKAMPFNNDPAPPEWHAAEQERSGRSSRKACARRPVNEHIFAGAVACTIHGWSLAVGEYSRQMRDQSSDRPLRSQSTTNKPVTRASTHATRRLSSADLQPR